MKFQCKCLRRKPTFFKNDGAGVAQRLCNGLPDKGTGFDSRRGQCKNRASHPSQGTVNGGDLAVGGTLNTTNTS